MMPATDPSAVVHKARWMKASSARSPPEVESVSGRGHPGLGVTVHAKGRLTMTLATLHRGGSGVYGVLVQIIGRVNADGAHSVGVTRLTGGRSVTLVTVAGGRPRRDTVMTRKVRAMALWSQEAMVEAGPDAPIRPSRVASSTRRGH